jgi:hypothetical protein
MFFVFDLSIFEPPKIVKHRNHHINKIMMITFGKKEAPVFNREARRQFMTIADGAK